MTPNFGDPRLPARFWAKCIPEPMSGCWLWLAHLVDGYGHFRYRGPKRGAHRVAFEVLAGPVPDGLQIDHLCRTRCCVNPAHMEPVTQAENIRRGALAPATAARHAAVAHCPRGHEYTEANTRIRMLPNRSGRRYPCRSCKACDAGSGAARRAG